MKRSSEFFFWSFVFLLLLYIVQAAAMVRSAASLKEPTLAAAAKSQGLPYDERGSLQAQEALKAEGRDVSLHFSPAFLPATNGLDAPGGKLFPLGGMSGRQVLHCNEFGRWETYLSDEHGFNNPKGLYKAPLDLLLIGDSFTEGACVAPGQDAASLLRRKRPKTLTLGMGGAGPLIELAALKEYGEPLRPKAVAWLYYASDLSDLANELRSETLVEYTGSEGFSQGLLGRQKEIDAAWAAYGLSAASASLRPQAGARESGGFARRAGRFLTFYYLEAAWKGYRPLSREDLEQLSLYLDVTLLAKRRVEAWGGSFIFVYLPERLLFKAPERSDRFRATLLAALRERGVKVVDVAETFRRDPEPLSHYWLGLSTHYDAKGYAAVASALDAAKP